MALNPKQMNTLTEKDAYGDNKGLSQIGQLWNDISGQTASMNKQYKQNTNIARHQYQWAVEDMKKAGLNPAMLFGGGGGHTATASTGIGGGGANHFSNAASMINSIANLSNSYNRDGNKSNDVNIAELVGTIIKLLI